MKELKGSGIDLVKDPEGGEKWIAPNESYYTIYFEKRKVKDIWVYEISVIIWKFLLNKKKFETT